MTALESARAKAAARYPETITDSKGRAHPNVPRRAILLGSWDNGSLVRSFVAALDDVEGVG